MKHIIAFAAIWAFAYWISHFVGYARKRQMYNHDFENYVLDKVYFQQIYWFITCLIVFIFMLAILLTGGWILSKIF